MAIKVEEYIREDASNPYKQWFDSLSSLFGGGTKRGQQRDIDRAKELLAEYKARKKMMSVKSSSKQKG